MAAKNAFCRVNYISATNAEAMHNPPDAAVEAYSAPSDSLDDEHEHSVELIENPASPATPSSSDVEQLVKARVTSDEFDQTAGGEEWFCQRWKRFYEEWRDPRTGKRPRITASCKTVLPAF